MGNVVKLPVSAIYDEQQKAKTRKRRPLYTPPPRLARAASLVNGSSSTSSTVAEAVSNHDPLVDAHRRLIGEVFFLRNQVQNMLAHRDLLIQQRRQDGSSGRNGWRSEWNTGTLKKSIVDICSGPGEPTSRRGVSPGLPPRDPLWGRDSRRILLSE
ncbi:LOW QUALITY PROTEIN: hypothetical protein HID58_067042 [Brassica napus]|uniref:Uncharacterized protein n=1 Tax=Brassica napus TaxID=3708 RepID=A0ABQ7ZHG9_BRANA|nr:LOW QUALITY PROTEIN: hypothetical protein HID58_067042 [Brassica napus]